MELERVQRSRKQILLAMELGLAAGADALSSLERLKEREGALLQGEPRATPGPGEEIEGVLSVLEAGLPLEVKRAIVRCLVAGIEVGERSVTLMARSTPEAGGICHRQ
jgi:hypothetical protein